MPARRRQFAPRPASEAHGQRAQSSSSYDSFILNKESFNASLCRPDHKNSFTAFRILPARDPVDPNNNLLPGRLEDGEFSKWYIGVRGASFVGAEKDAKISFLLYPPNTSPEEERLNPYLILQSAFSRVFGSREGKFHGPGIGWDPAWTRLMPKKGGNYEDVGLERSKEMVFIQCWPYKIGKKDFTEASGVPLGRDDRDSLQIMCLTSEAFNNIVNLANTANAAGTGYKYGDPVGVYDTATQIVKGGVIVHLFNASEWEPARNSEGLPVDSSWDGTAPKSGIWGYHAHFSKSYKKTYRPDMDAAATDRVFDTVQFWTDNPDDPADKGVLRFAPYEQQALWLVQAFSSIPRLSDFFNYGLLNEHPEYATDEVNAAIGKRVSSLAGAAPIEEDEAPAAPLARSARRPVDVASSQAAEGWEEDESPAAPEAAALEEGERGGEVAATEESAAGESEFSEEGEAAELAAGELEETEFAEDLDAEMAKEDAPSPLEKPLGRAGLSGLPPVTDEVDEADLFDDQPAPEPAPAAKPAARSSTAAAPPRRAPATAAKAVAQPAAQPVRRAPATAVQPAAKPAAKPAAQPAAKPAVKPPAVAAAAAKSAVRKQAAPAAPPLPAAKPAAKPPAKGR